MTVGQNRSSPQTEVSRRGELEISCKHICNKVFVKVDVLSEKNWYFLQSKNGWHVQNSLTYSLPWKTPQIAIQKNPLHMSNGFERALWPSVRYFREVVQQEWQQRKLDLHVLFQNKRDKFGYRSSQFSAFGRLRIADRTLTARYLDFYVSSSSLKSWASAHLSFYT